MNLKNNRSQWLFSPKKILSPKFWVMKNFESRQSFYLPKNFRSKNLECLKIFGFKKIMGPKKYESWNSFGPENFRPQKILIQKKNLTQKIWVA